MDVYGKCGTLKCGKPTTGDTTGGKECFQPLENKYFFYLALENSLCRDYITEKFFRTMTYNIIPVTYNGVNMTDFAPPHSYIDATQFKSIEELATYLLKVCILSIHCVAYTL